MFTILISMPVEIDEPVKVGAVFSRGEVRPVWFFRSGRQIRIREITFTWKTWEGSATVLHFSVTDGQRLYELRFNIGTLGWRIMNAECGIRNGE
mgnify:CR=1 FL=1